MIRTFGPLAFAATILVAASCAQGVSNDASGSRPGGAGDGGTTGCATCGSDGSTSSGPKLETTFPPYGLTWTSSGNAGRAGGLTWTYTGINRSGLNHVYWIVCDDPATPCGLSLDGPIDTPAEQWQYDATESVPANGTLVFTNATNIQLADGGSPPLSGQLTVTILDEVNAPIPAADVATLGVTARDGKYGSEIKGTSFTVNVLMEVNDSGTFTPYLDYYDSVQTPDTGDAGGNATLSFGGSFYDD